MLEKLAKQTAVYGISTIVVRFLSYLLTPYYTRIFGQETYGIVTDVYALIPLALTLLTMGMESSYFRFSAKAEEAGGDVKAAKRRLFATTWGVTSLAAAVFFLATAFFRDGIARMMGEAYVAHPEYVVWVGLIILFDVWACIPFSRLREQGRAMTFVGLKALNVALNVALAFGFGAAGLFASEFGGEPLMMMCSDLLKVGLVTVHIPVSAVSASISKEGILSKLRALRHALIQDFSVREPRIAVLSLNPHAGDGGLIGQEEEQIIAPAIQAAFAEKILAFGPFPADGFFAAAAYRKYDAVLAMYHDQGLAPFKALSEGGVNFTAGLPVVRTSPAHGVGFDIAGRGIASGNGMREAIYMAIDVLRSRRIYRQISANPLRKYKRETGADVSASELPEQSEGQQ